MSDLFAVYNINVCHFQLGQLSYKQGRLEEALGYFVHDLQLTRADVGTGHPRVACKSFSYHLYLSNLLFQQLFIIDHRITEFIDQLHMFLASDHQINLKKIYN